MRLTLVRHGPTQWNALDRFQGRTDVPLSPVGRIDAEAIAAALRQEKIQKIYSSDLTRALETARAIAAGREMPIVPDRRLREFDFGSWEGRTWGEIVAANPALSGQAPTAAKLYAPEGGETFAQVRRRVQSFVDELRTDDRDAHILVVTHAGPLHAFLSVLGLAQLGASAVDFDRFTPGGLTRMALEGGRAHLISLNEKGHLDARR